ncbi:MAG: phytanoyl-CoA dioxygenase family protein [Caldilineaceae bacterium]|nr:phytanoyl-CoA dioxygenase family protein [Caldilineaceae bacterium]
MASPTRYDLDLKLAELRINGYVLFEDLIPIEKVDQIREAFLPYLEQVRAHSDSANGVMLHGRSDERLVFEGRLQVVNRYTLYVPWEQPFADPEIYENPVLLEFLDRYWGTEDYRITCYHSNNPYPGSEYQRWHRDAGISKLVPHVGLEVCPHFGVKFPLVDTYEENGSFEILPCTQYLADPEMETQYDEILEAGDFPTRRRLNLKKGTLWIQDPRTLHRGTPNRSEHARPELVICYSLPWFGQRVPIEMTQAEYDKISERGRRLHTTCRVI